MPTVPQAFPRLLGKNYYSLRVEFAEVSENEFEEFKRLHLLTGVADLSKSFGIPESVAQKITEQQFNQSLPDGFKTRNHYFYFIKQDGKKRIGHIWFCVRDFFGIQKIFLCDIRIDESHRGQGVGKKSMTWLEAKTKELGLSEIALHVYGTNRVAMDLYKKLGFSPTSVHMSKKI